MHFKLELSNLLVGTKPLLNEVIIVLIELTEKSRITVPEDIIKRLGLIEGDKLEIVEKDGFLQITPVAVYPGSYIKDLADEVEDVKMKIKSEKQLVFEDVDKLFKNLDSE